jgi:hypothetical protein
MVDVERDDDSGVWVTEEQLAQRVADRLAEEGVGPGVAGLVRRVARLEYLLVRLATRSPEVLPPDAHEVIADLVRAADRTVPCPVCGQPVPNEPYDIGSGPELACPCCEWCWGVHGQPLLPLPLVGEQIAGGRRAAGLPAEGVAEGERGEQYGRPEQGGGRQPTAPLGGGGAGDGEPQGERGQHPGGRHPGTVTDG